MKTLVVYYSRTGTTKKVGEEIAKKLKADAEELFDTANRSGIWGWLTAGRDGMKRRLTKIRRPEKNPGEYDLVIIGTPIWAGNISAPTRTYLSAFKGKFQKVAFFCTMGGRGDEKAFSEMSEIIDIEPVNTLAFASKELVDENHAEKMEKFISSVREN